jgi:hypothetical protein
MHLKHIYVTEIKIFKAYQKLWACKTQEKPLTFSHSVSTGSPFLVYKVTQKYFFLVIYFQSSSLGHKFAVTQVLVTNCRHVSLL